jgi:hypothetical protein
MNIAVKIVNCSMLVVAALALIYEQIVQPWNAFEHSVIFGLIMILVGVANLEGHRK